MTRLEHKLMDFVQRHILFIIGAVFLMMSGLWRVSMWQAQTADYTDFFAVWIEQLRTQGIAASLKAPESNYSPLYQVLLWLFTLLPVSPLTAAKLLPTAFDAVCAVLLVLLAQNVCEQKFRQAGMAAMLCIGVLLPVSVLNSAYWGQCDSVYTAFLLAALVCLVKGRDSTAVMICAVAVCFKLQALFFLPVLVIVYAVKRSFCALWFLSVPLLLLLSGIPSALAGGNIFSAFKVYFEQAQMYKHLTMNYPNFYTFTQGGSYDLLAKGGIIAALMLLGGMLAWLLYSRCRLHKRAVIMLSVWCTLVCTLFLPSMHERYAFYAEITIWLSFITAKQWKSLWIPALLQAVVLVTYSNYFWGYQGVPGWLLTLINYALFLLLTQRTVQLCVPACTARQQAE